MSYTHVTTNWEYDDVFTTLKSCIRKTSKEMIVWRCMRTTGTTTAYPKLDPMEFLNDLRRDGKVQVKRNITSTSTSLDRILTDFCNSGISDYTHFLLKIKLPIGIPYIDVNECNLIHMYETKEILDEIVLLGNFTLKLNRVRHSSVVDELQNRPFTRSGNILKPFTMRMRVDSGSFKHIPYKDEDLYVFDVDYI